MDWTTLRMFVRPATSFVRIEDLLHLDNQEVVGLFCPKNSKHLFFLRGRVVILKHQNVRNRLIENTIKIIAENGFDKTTTKAIVSGTGINEAYIYRDFADKEDLFVKVFEKLDEELLAKLMQHLPVIYMRELEYELRCRVFFDAIWKFLIDNKEKCLAFMRYYYSPYFKKYSADKHKQRYRPLVEKFSEAFIDEADVWMILNHVLDVMLSFAVKVHSDQMPNEDSYSEHVFRVVYRSIEQYFKKKEVPDND